MDNTQDILKVLLAINERVAAVEAYLQKLSEFPTMDTISFGDATKLASSESFNCDQKFLYQLRCDLKNHFEEERQALINKASSYLKPKGNDDERPELPENLGIFAVM